MQIIRSFSSNLRSNRERSLKYSAIKICSVYLIISLNWIYFSDRVANKLFNDKHTILIINTYKGWVYVFVTAIIIYILIADFLNKVYLTEEKLNKSYIELEQANEELQAYVQQLAASEEELRVQYDNLVESKEKLAQTEEKNKNIIRAIPDLIFILGHNGNFIDCNTNDGNKLLVPKEEFIGKNIYEILPKQISEKAYNKMQVLITNGELQSFEYEWEYNGTKEYFEARMVKNSEEEIMCIARDITERKNMELKLKYLSYHDQLTGLYNRRFYNDKLEDLDIDENLPVTIVMADVNGLKLVNDSFGHAAGDELLKKVSKAIIKGCRKEDIIARIGGDEFIIILPKADNHVAERVIENIKFIASKMKVVNSINISISFGYSSKLNSNESIKEIIKKAEDYMYKKKLIESSSMREKAIEAIISTFHKKNKVQEEHSFRTADLCEKMGIALSLSESDIKDIRTAGLFHDIGKIAIEEDIINKKEDLTMDEIEKIKRHPEIGYRILNTVNDMLGVSNYILLHHERWDGLGYPKGLKGEDIPLPSRIISIADAYDYMTDERNNHDAITEESAVQRLKEASGTEFDPKLLKIFIEKVLKKYSNT